MAGWGPCACRSGSALFIQPLVSVSVGAAPACSISHCQGGVATVDAASRAANGTFYNRLLGTPTFPVMLGMAEGITGEEFVAVTVRTPIPGLTCTVLFSAPPDGVEVVLG